MGFKGSVAISCATLAALAPAVTAGIYTQYISDSATSAAVLAAGVNSVIYSTSVAEATITDMIAAGVDVWIYDITRRYWVDHYAALGVRGIFTGDPAYLSATAALRTTDPFASGYWFPGQQMNANSRGVLTGGALQLGTAGQNSSVLLGYLCPVANAASTWTLTYTTTFIATGGSGSASTWVHICSPDDRANPNNISSGGYADGYRVALDQYGSLAIYKSVRGGSETLLNYHSGTAPTNGYAPQIVVTVTPTTITAVTPAEPARTVTVTDSSYRGGYIHAGQAGLASSLITSLSAITVS